MMQVRKVRSLSLRDRPITEARHGMTFQTLSADHQRLALFQTQVQFWAYFIASWTMFGVGLVPLGYLLFVPAPPSESKLMAIGLSASSMLFPCVLLGD